MGCRTHTVAAVQRQKGDDGGRDRARTDDGSDAVRCIQEDDDCTAHELEALVTGGADEVVVGPLGHKRHTDPKHEGGADDEATAADMERRTEYPDTGHDDVAEEEGRHAAQHAVRDRVDDGRDLINDAKDNQVDAAVCV